MIFSKHLPLLIVVVAVFTFFFPYYLDVANWVPSFLLAIVIFFTGLSMKVDAIKKMKSNYFPLLLATVFKWTFTVLISVFLAYAIFSSRPEIAAGVILSGTVPNATAATLYTFIAGGNASLVVAASLVDIMISPLVTPLALLGLGEDTLRLSFLSLLQSFFLIVILPISLGILAQKKAPKLITKSVFITKVGSAIALLLIIHTIVAGAKETIAEQLFLIPLISIVAFLQVVLPMVLVYLLFQLGWLRIVRGDMVAIVFHVGLCNTALAAILAIEFISELAALPAILNMVINLSLGSLLANYWGKEETIEVDLSVDVKSN